MLKKETRAVLDTAKGNGWVMEPDANAILQSYGIRVPRFTRAMTMEEALQWSQRSFPLESSINQMSGEWFQELTVMKSFMTPLSGSVKWKHLPVCWWRKWLQGWS